MSEDRCEVCKFVKKASFFGMKAFVCRRYPPLPIQTWDAAPSLRAKELKFEHPKVEPSDWCGEFESAT